METMIRIHEGTSHGYGKYYIQVLAPKSYSKDLEVAFTLSWQSNQDSLKDFYGLSYQCEGSVSHSEISRVKFMLKTLILIEEYCTSSSIDEVKNVIGAVECFFHSPSGSFVAKRDIGSSYFHVISEKGTHYDNIIAHNEILAQRKLDSMIKLKKADEGSALKFKYKIEEK